jgi:hypothetical protein
MTIKPKKRGRKLGVKIGPYKLNISEISNRLKELEKRVTKLEKVLS